MAVSLNLRIVPSYSLDTLVIRDISEYGNTIISNPSFEITPPGYPKVNIPFVPKQTNEYTSAHLEICDADTLPDGIYTVKYSVRPNVNNFVEKTFIKVDKLVCQYEKLLLILLEPCDCEPYRENLHNIKLLIEGSIAAANICDTKMSVKLYKKAKDMIDQATKGCNC